MTYEQDTLTFASGVVLDLAVPENRMFAVEISSYHAGLDSYVKQVAARPAGNKVSSEAGYIYHDLAMNELNLESLSGQAVYLDTWSPEIQCLRDAGCRQTRREYCSSSSWNLLLLGG